MDETDADIKEFIKKYWSSIRTFSKKNKVQNIFNFYYNKNLKEMVKKITEAIMKEEKNCFKINYSLAYILRNVIYFISSELCYFHASYNNHLMLEIALLISNKQELFDFLNSIAEESFIENINKTRHKMENNSNFKHYLLHQSFARRAIRSSHSFTRFHHEEPQTYKRLSGRESFSGAWPCSMVLIVVAVIELQSNCFMNTVPILT